MKKNLERFVRDNREDFDAFEPSFDLWARIETGLATDTTAGPFSGPDVQEVPMPRPGKEKPFGSRFTIWRGLDWRVAASVAVLLLAGAFFYANHRYGVTEQPEVVAVNPSYAREFVQYTRLVDLKREELKQMTASNPELYKTFAKDLDRLGGNYQTLKADLPENPNQEVLVQAMIQNLQLQIDLLNEQLRVIQRIKQQSQNTDEHLI